MAEKNQVDNTVKRTFLKFLMVFWVCVIYIVVVDAEGKRWVGLIEMVVSILPFVFFWELHEGLDR